MLTSTIACGALAAAVVGLLYSWWWDRARLQRRIRLLSKIVCRQQETLDAHRHAIKHLVKQMELSGKLRQVKTKTIRINGNIPVTIARLARCYRTILYRN